jgi:hypothetical protein
MKAILQYLRDYSRDINGKAFLSVSLFMALLVTVNYSLGLERQIIAMVSAWRFTAFFLLFAFVFGSAWLFQFLFIKKLPPPPSFFYFLLLIAAAIFAMKMSVDGIAVWLTSGLSTPWDNYSYQVLNWPVKCVLVSGAIAAVWKYGGYEKPMAGLYGKGFDVEPYLLLLLFMLPLLAFAATQADFLHTYPKVKRIAFIGAYTGTTWPWKGLYELSYGIDFFSIELFFRGFLVLAFVRYAGKHAILPMAAFYCCIHFGKPLFECITSYFGGLILGAVVYHTRSIWGGLIVHLGIAWLMEVAGYLGNLK